MQETDDGALLFLVLLEVHLRQHHFRIKDWRFSQAAQVHIFLFVFAGFTS
jgi:hypothetical protein